MNYEQALEASKHNPAGVNKVLEGLEIKDIRCKGTGKEPKPDPRTGITRNFDECLGCGGTGKIYYSHIPQVGEWIYDNNSPQGQIFLVVDVDMEVEQVGVFDWEYDVNIRRFDINSVTLLLEWEEIERVLEKAGFSLIVNNMSCNLYDLVPNQKRTAYFIAPDNPRISTNGKNRQEAVYNAVLALGKEMK